MAHVAPCGVVGSHLRAHFLNAPHGGTQQNHRFAHSSTANERGPRLFRAINAPAGPLEGVGADPDFTPGREAVFTPQVELVHSVCVLLWRAAGRPPGLLFGGSAGSKPKLKIPRAADRATPGGSAASVANERCLRKRLLVCYNELALSN